MKRKRYLWLVSFGCLVVARALFAQAGNDNPGGVTNEFNGSSTIAGHYDPYTGNASRVIDDIVVTGSIGAYPLKLTRTLDTRGHGVPNQFGEGGGWTHGYTSGLTIFPPNENDGEDGWYSGQPAGTITYPGGGHFDLPYSDGPPWHIYGANGRLGPVDILAEGGAGHYELRRGDGGKVLFEPAAVATTYRPYAIIDPYGQTTVLTYDANGRLWKVTEPGGRYLEFVYGTYYRWVQSNPPQRLPVTLISMVRANDGRGNVMETVAYEYEAVWVTYENVGSQMFNLTAVHYDDRSQASYTYAPANTNWTANSVIRESAQVVHSCDDPRYAGPMKQIQYEYVGRLEASDVGRGQIKAEKNLYGQIVSRTTFPASVSDPNRLKRTETRGDGATRFFEYPITADPNAFSFTWTDFQNHTSGYRGLSIVDARGSATTYEKEPVIGAIKKITHPGDGSTREYTFTDPQRPYYHSGEKDENGNWTFFDRDANNSVTRVRYPDGSTDQFTYNAFGQVLTHRLKSGGTETFTYDTRGLKQTSCPPATESDPDPWNHPTRYYYYTSGANTDRLQRVQDPRGNSTWFEYNQRGQTTKVTHQDGSYTQSAYNLDGTLAWTADENHPGAATDPNQRTRYIYDEYKRVRTVTNPMGETTENWYGLDANWQNPLLQTTTTPKYTLSPMGKNIVFDYDANLRKIAQTAAAGTSDVATTWFDYDEVGNLTWTRDPRMNVTTFGYDARNRKIWMNDPIATDRNANGHTMDWEYDGVGNKLKETRADNAFRSWIYDVPNRTTYAVDWRLSLAEPALTTTITRNATGRVETITDPKLSVYTLEFDELLRKTKETYPANVGNANLFETWRYDAAGNLDRYTSRDGSIKQFAPYDNRNRATSFTWSNEPAGRTTQGQSFQYDAASRVMALHNAEAEISFQYDWANRKTSETETIRSYGLNQTHTVTYDYDDNGNRSQMVYPGGWDYRYAYTERGQLANIRLAWLSNPTVQYSYDGAGNRLRRTNYPGAYTDYVYNPLNQLSSQVSYLAGATPRFDYGFDAVNRIKYEQRDGGTADGFTYDPRSELTGFNQNGTLSGNGTVTANYNVAISYDSNGNRIDAFDGSNAHYVTKPNNQYASDWTGALGYDGNANLTTRAGWSYGYDAQNRLTSIDGGSTHIRYHYDPLNRIVAWDKNGAITTQVWDNWNLIEEHTGTDAFQRMYLHGAATNEVVVSYGPAWGDAYYWQDGRGNVTHLTDGSNNVKERYTYFVSGQPTYWTASTMNNRFLFEGAMYIPEAEIYDMRNRFYHPNLGRFMQSDPIGFDAGDMNLFRYCGNDPVDGSDPTGLYKVDPRGLTPEQVKQVEEEQRATADLVRDAAARVDRAIAAGPDSKELKSVKDAYEKVNGKNSATEKNLKEFSKTAKKMETALRDDGTKGYVLTAHDQNWFVKKWNDARVLGDGDVNGKTIRINTEKVFKSGFTLRWTLGHESGHNAGLLDYWYKHQPEYHTIMTTEESLENADSYMDFINRR